MERRQFRQVTPCVARAAIAAGVLGTQQRLGLGGISLHEHQLEAVELVRRAIRQYGGALLCDPVGTGKTFTALAVARDYDSVVVVAPAALKQMWVDSAERTGSSIAFLSHESLSRGSSHSTFRGLVIVDEAHHVRNPATRRYEALAQLAAEAPMLLLTATPVHNRRKDLAALVALFSGDSAYTMSEAELAAVVVGRESLALTAGAPVVAPTEWLDVVPDDRIVEQLLALPPPVPVRGGGTASRLVLGSLVRQWASSDAALRAGLRRRVQRAVALISALESGTYPSQAELTAWTVGDDAVQLAFPELVATSASGCGALLDAVRAHLAAIERLRGIAMEGPDRDDERFTLLRHLRRRHAGVPIVAFTQYEETAVACYRALSPDGGVAMLSGRSGRVAGGAITRDEVVCRFAPRANRARSAPRAQAVSLLVTTDLLSEGFNLQDAGVVVHLDLPWTPARLQQRLGRVARMGSQHERVHSYAFRPPASAEAIVRIERILEDKISCMRSADSAPREATTLRSILHRWKPQLAREPVVASVRSRCDGFIAAISSSHGPSVVCSLGDEVRDDPEPLIRAAVIAESPGCPVDTIGLRKAVAAISAHFGVSTALSGLAPAPAGTPGVRKQILSRISRAMRRARHHNRARIAALAVLARRAAAARSGAFAERRLEEMLRLEAPDEQWLSQVAELSHAGIAAVSHRDWEIRAIILFSSAPQRNALSDATER